MGLSFPEHSSHQELLCTDLDLAGTAQHGAQGHSLPYMQPGFDASLAARMASLGLQGSLIDNLHSTQWQARRLHSLISLSHAIVQSWSQTQASSAAASSASLGLLMKVWKKGTTLTDDAPVAHHIPLYWWRSMLSQSDQGYVGQAPILLPLAPSAWPIFMPEISAHQKGSSQARASPLAESSTAYAYRLSRSLVAQEAGLMG